MIEFISIPSQLVDFDSMIAHNETVACRNATVIVNQNGDVTAWYDNAKPVVIVMNNEEEGYKKEAYNI